MCNDDKFVRMIMKRGEGIPTIPSSDDHRNGDWLDTDIYRGEWYQDTLTGKVYTRNDADEITSPDGSIAPTSVFDAIISQSSTGAPTIDHLILDTIGGAFSYSAVGTYPYTKAGGFPNAGKVSMYVQQTSDFDGDVRAGVSSADVVLFRSEFTGSPSDDVISTIRVTIEVFA